MIRSATMLLSGLVVLATLACASMPAYAQANCEAIKSPFAYNECLAKSAPPRSQPVPRGAAASDPEATVRGRGRRTVAMPEQPRHGVAISRGQGRRVSAVIDPWAGVRRPAKRRR